MSAKKDSNDSPSPDASDGDESNTFQVIVGAAKALSHPLRIRILKSLAGSPQSVPTLSRLLKTPRNAVHHHLDFLQECGAVEDAGSRRGRVAPERFVRLQVQPFGSLPFDQLPGPLRKAPYAALLQIFFEMAVTAINLPPAASRADNVLFGRPIVFDSQGWKEAEAALNLTNRELVSIEKASRQRIREAGPGTAINGMVGVSMIQLPDEIPC